MKNYILAHDLGTTGNKATLYDAEGHLVGSVFYGYATEYAHPRWAEQDPEDWWRAVCTSTHTGKPNLRGCLKVSWPHIPLAPRAAPSCTSCNDR